MKNKKIFILLVVILINVFSTRAQDNVEQKLNLPGDNLNLFAVLNLFQESETLEIFEKNLNSDDSKINNLDLNNDEKIDYIKVFDTVEGESHMIVMQVAVNEKENQDIAVFSISKDEKKQIQIQLIGDEELYGKNYIIEPNSAETFNNNQTPNPGYSTNTTSPEGKTVVVEKTIIVQVQTWPIVTYVYTPSYVIWRSPWYWGYYPSYWNPWRPYYWDYYYGYHSHWHSHYHGHYHNSQYYRNPLYRNNYYNRSRSQATTVSSNNKSGIYNKTYSRPDLRKDGITASKTQNFNKQRPTFKTENNLGNTKQSNQTGIDIKNQGTKVDTKPSIKPATNTTRPSVNTTRPAARPTVRPAARPASRSSMKRNL